MGQLEGGGPTFIVDIYHTVYHCIPDPFSSAGGAVSGMERCAMPEAGSGAIGWGYNWN